MDAPAPSIGAPERLVASVRSLARRLERVRPLYVVGAFVALEWLVVLGVAMTVRHNGWLWYQGGDQVWFYTTSWGLLHGQLPATSAGYGWSVLLLPIAALGGPNLLHALPAIVLLNVLVLMPAAMAATYGVGVRLGGRLAGYWVLVVWIVTPLAGVLYTNAGYHQKYSELTLPQAMGLTAMSDFPSMVMLAVSAYFVVRTVQGGGWADGALAGLFAGFGIGIKPSSGLYLGGLLLGVVAARRLRSAVWVGAGLALPLLTLLLWKWRGLGHVPLLHAAAPRRLALGGGGIVGLGLHPSKYLHFSYSHLAWNIDLLREHFWSGRLIVWLVLAGIVALGRRSLAAALLVGGWFLAFAVVKGSTQSGSIQDSSLLRMLIPTIPAFVLLLAALPLLLPRVPSHLPATPPRPWATARLRLTLVVAAILLFAVVPTALAVTTHPVIHVTGTTYGNTASIYNEEAGPIPVDNALDLRAAVHGGRVALDWHAQPATHASFAYAVVRTPLAAAGRYFPFSYSQTWLTSATHYVDVVPYRDRDTYVYRVLVAAAWSGDPAQGDGFVASKAVVVPLLLKGQTAPTGVCGVRAEHDGDWEAVFGHAVDAQDAATINTRVFALVHVNDLTVEVDDCRDYEAVAKFPTQAEAEALVRKLVAAGYTRKWHVQPTVEQS